MHPEELEPHLEDKEMHHEVIGDSIQDHCLVSISPIGVGVVL